MPSTRFSWLGRGSFDREAISNLASIPQTDRVR